MDAICCATCGCDTLVSDDTRRGLLCQGCEDEHAEYAGGSTGCGCAGEAVEVACRRWRAEVRRRDRER